MKEFTEHDLLIWSRRAARATLPENLLDGYLDDIAQETAIAAMTMVRKGFIPTWSTWKREARRARRAVFGDPRSRVPWDKNELTGAIDVETSHAAASATRREEGAILIKRLRDTWPFFTDQQKWGLLQVLDDGYGSRHEYAELAGTTPGSLDAARGRALKRLNNPSEFSRRAHVGVRELPREEFMAYNRWKARRRRERQRARCSN